LFEDLRRGSYEAGEYLVALYEAGALERSHGDILLVRRHQATIRRGDPTTLQRLQATAQADHNEAYGAAVAHVRHAFDGSQAGTVAPLLRDLTAQPELNARLLFSDLSSPVNEALAIICETGILRRDLGYYKLAAGQRVALGAQTPIGSLFSMTARLLELPGVRLFHRARQGELRSSVVLLNPLGAVIDGEANDESPELSYRIGSALAAALPPCALAEALGPKELRDVIAALLTGFGPPGASGPATAEQLRLAEDMWHVVSPAAERRLRDLCADPEEISFERARSRARQACRRAGLFVSGDFAMAVRLTIAELELRVRTPLDDPMGLAALCSNPAIADLWDLATSPEYAEARWNRQPRSAKPRG